MYRTILVPLDGSAFGEQALPVALGIARRAGATVRLAHVHVVEQPAYINEPATSGDAGDLQAQAAEHACIS
jgi:nucleotide-binding universal stress UspA family protein